MSDRARYNINLVGTMAIGVWLAMLLVLVPIFASAAGP